MQRVHLLLLPRIHEEKSTPGLVRSDNNKSNQICLVDMYHYGSQSCILQQKYYHDERGERDDKIADLPIQCTIYTYNLHVQPHVKSFYSTVVV